MQPLFTVFAVLSVVALVFFFWKLPQKTQALAPIMISLLSLLFNVSGAFRSTKVKESEGKKPPRRAAKRGNQFLAASFKSGFFGGLIGGGVAGLLNGVSYYLSALQDDTPATWENILSTFTFACVCGGVFGALSQFLIMGVRQLLPTFILSDVIGGTLGGGLAGTVMGYYAASLFGQRGTRGPDTRLVFWGGIFSAFCIVLGVLLFDHKASGKTVKRALSILLPTTIVIAPIGLYALMAGGFGQKYFEIDDPRILIERGAKVGALIGALWGLLLGLTLATYRLVFKDQSSPKLS